MIENKIIKDKALLVGVNVADDLDFEDSMLELIGLTQALEIKYQARIDQNLVKIDPSFYVGYGKIKEIKNLIAELDCNIVIFNDELTPSQIRNIDKELKSVVILDRTSLILEIFARRAKTKESRIQVEMASLKYSLPRLIGSHSYLGRQGGGGKRNKGLGETKLELDRRRIGSRLIQLHKELEQVKKERENRRGNRQMIPMVSLIGYTNAGKSTLMNTLLDKYGQVKSRKVVEKDMLFTTLDTTIRSINLPSKTQILISDTVGFISRLPHNLVESFHSTLEEVLEATVLLHVVDYTDDKYLKKMEVTNQVINDIIEQDIPIITVYNKVENNKVLLFTQLENEVYISAKTGLGIERLMELIEERIYQGYQYYQLFIPYENSKEAYQIISNLVVVEEKEDEFGFYFKVFTKPQMINKYKKFIRGNDDEKSI